ncbi:DDB1- and CUL4-associated factor 1 [Bulinus truncatus]|nr:DDB1- and CUL4-associated factor 1 [Bulinus truncatus]
MNNQCAAEILAEALRASNLDLEVTPEQQAVMSGGWQFCASSTKTVWDAVRNPRTRFTYDDTLKELPDEKETNSKMANQNLTPERMEKLRAALNEWNISSNDPVAFDPVHCLNKLAELLELETEEYYKMDPDPLNDQLSSSSSLGQMMEKIITNEGFIYTIISRCILQGHYSEGGRIFTAACRVLLDLLPGLDARYIYGTPGVALRFLHWAEFADEPLKSYATGLLSIANFLTEEIDYCVNKMVLLVPLLLQRLHALVMKDKEEQLSTPSAANENSHDRSSREEENRIGRVSHDGESSFAEMRPPMIGSYSLWPLTSAVKQRLILQSLTPLWIKPEVVPILEHNAVDLMLDCLNIFKNQDKRLVFDALEFLSKILFSEKFAKAFIKMGGVQKLLGIRRSTMTASGVSLCFDSLRQNKNVVERIVLLPECVLNDFVQYQLWLMEFSNDAFRNNACNFIFNSLHFKVMLKHFDQNDGQRRLIHMISALPILTGGLQGTETTDELAEMKKTLNFLCDTLFRYFEVHTALKADELRSLHHLVKPSSSLRESQSTKGFKFNTVENMDILLKYLPPESTWMPEINIHELGGINILCRIIALTPKWGSFPSKRMTLISALDVLAMCAVSHRTQLQLCGNVDLPDNVTSPIMSIFFDMVQDVEENEPEVIKAVLRLVVNCVCGPEERFGSIVVQGYDNHHMIHREEDVLSWIWHNVRINNGLVALLRMLLIKKPSPEADELRMLACKALVGMSRSETIRHIIGKLPPVHNGHLLILMKEPVMTDQRNYHNRFCDYASTLLKTIAGVRDSVPGASTLQEIQKAGIVAETKIFYHKTELLQLIHEHLKSEGLHQTASLLQKEADLCSTPQPLHVDDLHLYSPYGPETEGQISQPSTSAITSQVNRDELIPGVSASSTGKTAEKGVPSTASMETPALSSSGLLCSKTPVAHQATPHHKNKDSFSLEKCVLPFCASKLKGTQSRDYDVTLDKIVTEHLRKQHALCPQPISTCPTMSLFTPHRCPEPLGRTNAAFSVTSRLFDRQNDFHTTLCHSSPITHISISKANPDLLFTSTLGMSENCALWRYDRLYPNLELKYRLRENRANLANQSSDKFIATNKMVAKIYDTSTSSVVQTFFDEKKANNYQYNEATFSPTDDLILNDGNLWDVRSGKMIQKFEKLNRYSSGCFHPHGLEVIINSGIWDMRMFRILHTVPALNRCQITFNHNGDVLYAIKSTGDLTQPRDSMALREHASTFRIFDAIEYTEISKFDLDADSTSVLDFAVDRNDLLIAVVEITASQEADEAVCRIYELGKNKEPEIQDKVDKDNSETDDDSAHMDNDSKPGDSNLNLVDPFLEFVHASSNQDEGDGGAENENVLRIAKLTLAGSGDDGDENEAI